jgi:peptidoglycan DL-endopeptidase CwlO
MAEHRARHGSASGAIRAADLLARFEVGSGSAGHRRRAGGLALAGAGGAAASFSLPALTLPSLPPLPSMPSAQTGRTLIAAMSAGAVGVTAAIVATGGMAPVTPQQPTDVQLAANPAAAPAAAAFALTPGQTEEAGHAAAPVTGADLAAAAQPSAPALPTSVATPGASATASADATATPGTATPVPLEPDAADKARNAAEKAAAAAKKAPKTDPEPKVGAASSAGAKAVAFAKSEIGTPYRYGATGPSAYDCSGLVLAAFKKAGVSLPRTSEAQSKVGTPVSRDQLRPGDLVFFYSPVSHVGIYLGDGKIVHASTSGEPVKISDMGRRPFHNARRV